MAVCPAAAIAVDGRKLTPGDMFLLPRPEAGDGYEAFVRLAERRRSIRAFADEPVSDEYIQKIVDAVAMAPMSIPPSEVGVLILDSREKVSQFSKDICEAVAGAKWLTSPSFLNLTRFFRSKEIDAMFRRFLGPLMEAYTSQMSQGRNVILYDAPLAMYFYGSPYSDADQMIAATYAMLAGEALGLGTCLIGGVHPFLQHGPTGARLRKKYSIQYKSQTGLVVIFGHHTAIHTKGIRRRMSRIHRL
jgi:Nitroreductase